MPSLKYKFFSPIVSILPLKIWLIIFYVVRFRRFPNLINPKSFNEKILWRKLNDHNPIYSQMADKLESKELVLRLSENVAVPRTYWSGINVSEINVRELPSKFVLKANHASGTNYFVYDGEINANLEMLKNKWFSHDQYKSLGEWAYSNIPRKLFVEEYLDFNGSSPDDYKFFVYSGKVMFVQVDSDRFLDHKRNIFDREWNDLGISYSHPMNDSFYDKPTFIDEMIKEAEKISLGLDFVRVDLYWYCNKIWFGEYTIYPGAGYEPFPTYADDLRFGEHWGVG